MNPQDMGRPSPRTIPPEFEMIGPQKADAPFKGRTGLTHLAIRDRPVDDGACKARDGMRFGQSAMLKRARLGDGAVTIWTWIRRTDTILSGRYYSEPVQRDAPDINTSCPVSARQIANRCNARVG